MNAIMQAVAQKMARQKPIISIHSFRCKCGRGQTMEHNLTTEKLLEVVKSLPEPPDDVIIRVHPASVELLYDAVRCVSVRAPRLFGGFHGIPVQRSLKVPVGLAVMVNLSRIDGAAGTGDFSRAITIVSLRSCGAAADEEASEG